MADAVCVLGASGGQASAFWAELHDRGRARRL